MSVSPVVFVVVGHRGWSSLPFSDISPSRKFRSGRDQPAEIRIEDWITWALVISISRLTCKVMVIQVVSVDLSIQTSGSWKLVEAGFRQVRLFQKIYDF